jgi:hypothetical protein
MRDVQEAARAKGVQLHILKAGTESEVDAAFATLLRVRVRCPDRVEGALLLPRADNWC